MDQKTIVLYLHMKMKVKAKRNLIKYRAENLSELLVRIQVILRAILGETLIEGFLDGHFASGALFAFEAP
jgi:hypothetical protein